MRPLLSVALFLLLGSNAAAAGSRTSDALAYVRLTDGYWQVWVFDVSAGKHTQRTFTDRDKRYPAWGPDGSLFFRSNNDELYLLEAGSRAETPFARSSWPAIDPHWSAVRSQLAIAAVRTDRRDRSAIHLLSLAGTADHVVTPGPGLRMQPAWSPDGRALAFVDTPSAPEANIILASWRTSDTEAPELTEAISGSVNLYPAWHPSDARIAFASDRTGDTEIWIRDLRTQRDSQLTHHPGLDTRPAWSPDGTRIAYTRLGEERLEIWVMAEDGGDQQRLFSIDSDARDPAWH